MGAVYGQRWGRTATFFVASLGLFAAVFAAVRPQLLFAFDSSVTIQGGYATFSSSLIHADDVAFGTAMVQKAGSASLTPVLRAGFASATMNGFCLTKTESVPLLGDITVRLTSGDNTAATSEISAKNAVFDLTELKSPSNGGVYLNGSVMIGGATTDMTTTKTGSSYDANPLGVPPSFDAGWYDATANGGWVNGNGYSGIDATSADLKYVYGKIWQAQIAGNIKLPALKITISHGVSSCYDEAGGGSFPN